jgi:diaminopropionate ammonia-lyase
MACMRLLAGFGIVGGESGVASLAGCLLPVSDLASPEFVWLDRSSRVLVFNTEGATDPESYGRLVGICPNQLEL